MSSCALYFSCLVFIWRSPFRKPRSLYFRHYFYRTWCASTVRANRNNEIVIRNKPLKNILNISRGCRWGRWNISYRLIFGDFSGINKNFSPFLRYLLILEIASLSWQFKFWLILRYRKTASRPYNNSPILFTISKFHRSHSSNILKTSTEASENRLKNSIFEKTLVGSLQVQLVSLCQDTVCRGLVPSELINYWFTW